MDTALEWLGRQPPVVQSLVAGVATWWLTAAGAALVLAARRPGRLTLDGLFGFAAGVMVAASFWSLLPGGLLWSGSWREAFSSG
jgi:ZIP family zinc transporter